MTWIYLKTEADCLTVGHYDPQGRFIPESDHTNRGDAAARVHYLNGGSAGGYFRRDRAVTVEGDLRAGHIAELIP